VTTEASQVRPRPYRSAHRQQQAAKTRALVLEAATSLFEQRGWSGTSIRDIAKDAGVAVETVYAGFGSKAALLLAAIDVSVVGDAQPVPLSDRAEFAALGQGDLTQRVEAAARLLAGINQRTWRLRRALSEAAVSDPQLALKLEEMEKRRRLNIAQGVEMVIGHAVLEDVLDGLWVFMGADAFHLLTEIGGRSPEQYEQWLVTTIQRHLDDAEM
jgi:AcrR family transcriptional regulator